MTTTPHDWLHTALRGASIEDLARRTGIPRRSIYRYRQGVSPPVDRAAALAAALGLELYVGPPRAADAGADDGTIDPSKVPSAGKVTPLARAAIAATRAAPAPGPGRSGAGGEDAPAPAREACGDPLLAELLARFAAAWEEAGDTERGALAGALVEGVERGARLAAIAARAAAAQPPGEGAGARPRRRPRPPRKA